MREIEENLLLQEIIVDDGGDVEQGIAYSQKDPLVRHWSQIWKLKNERSKEKNWTARERSEGEDNAVRTF